jgi:hypothetical protein
VGRRVGTGNDSEIHVAYVIRHGSSLILGTWPECDLGNRLRNGLQAHTVPTYWVLSGPGSQTRRTYCRACATPAILAAIKLEDMRPEYQPRR